MKENQARSHLQPSKQQPQITFKKSPNKFVFYDSLTHQKEEPKNTTKDTFLPYSLVTSQSFFPEYSAPRKNNPDASSLRHTLSYDSNLGLDMFRLREGDKIRNTGTLSRSQLGAKHGKHRSQLNVFSHSSIDWHPKDPSKTGRENVDVSSRFQSSALTESRASYDYKSYAQKLKYNNKLLEELKKLSSDRKEDSEDSRKVSERREEQEGNFKGSERKYSYTSCFDKETLDSTFKKKKLVSNQFYTPKLQKITYEERFDYSNSQVSNSWEKRSASNKTSASDALKQVAKPIPNKVNGNNPSISDFALGRKLGQGKFGTVYQSIHKATGGIFAVKKITKKMIKTNMMEAQLALQLRMQCTIRHKNIVKMYGFFDDASNLYLVLEYMDQGTLYSKLKKSGVLNEGDTARIISEITSAVDCLHDLGIAHRDIKPENIVMTNNVCKLCDFGWATFCDERRKTYCGTFDYAAPEILEGAEYDMTVDLWCLGVLTYELLAGKAPFYHFSRKETMKRIMNVEKQAIVYPTSFSKLAVDFIQQLIRKNPNQRIKAESALSHPFLKDNEQDQ